MSLYLVVENITEEDLKSKAKDDSLFLYLSEDQKKLDILLGNAKGKYIDRTWFARTKTGGFVLEIPDDPDFDETKKKLKAKKMTKEELERFKILTQAEVKALLSNEEEIS